MNNLDYQYESMLHSMIDDRYSGYGINYYMEDEMKKVRGQAYGTLSSIIDPSQVQPFAKLLAYGWMENVKEAEQLAENLSLDRLDILAIVGDLEEFEREFMHRKEKSQTIYEDLI